MAAVSDSSQISENLSKSSISTITLHSRIGQVVENENMKYGLPLLDVYKLAVSFYKEKEGKAVHFSYEDKLQLVAFTQQVLHGPYSDAIDKLPPLGAFDVVGKDRRLAWQKLGNLTADQARSGFVELLSRKCTLFSAFIEAHRREKKEQERIAIENEKEKIKDKEQRQRIAEEKVLQEQLQKDELIKRQIQQALNEQTYDQFRKYADQHYPGDPEKQGALVRQLQEQHYIQYMQQLQAVQQNNNGNVKVEDDSKCSIGNKPEMLHQEEETNPSRNNELVPEQELMPASMWTRSDIEEFKKSVAQAQGDGVVKVRHGETVTVRVPTHQAATRLFWEFSTDHYDIGFGVFFECGTPTTDRVSVHVSDSSDDEDKEDMDEELFENETGEVGDLEAGSLNVTESPTPYLVEVVPVYRRDCMKEVYAGSHQYPCPGVYLLKFDNSYSMWRSKTLYYRVYYTQ